MYTTLVLEWSIGTHHNAFIIYIIRSHYYLGISFAYSIILWFIILIFLSYFFLAYILVLINYFGSKYAVQTPYFRINWHFSLVIFLWMFFAAIKTSILIYLSLNFSLLQTNYNFWIKCHQFLSIWYWSKQWVAVYFDQRTGAMHAVCWSKSIFNAKTSFCILFSH